MKFSIVIPTVGGPEEKVIEESINSALLINPDICDQIIIIDNSKDEHVNSLINGLVNKDKRFETVVINKPLSMAECWNTGLQYVKNPWHLYLHDDDILIPKEVNNIAPHFDRETGFIRFGFDTIGAKNNSYSSSLQGTEGILHNTPKFVSTFIHTTSLKELGGWDEKAGYFLDTLSFILLDSKYGSSTIKNVIGKYRLHKNNASQKEKRAQTYVPFLPYTLNKIYQTIHDNRLRRMATFHLTSFAFPHQKLLSKSLSKTSSLLGTQAWINE